MASKLSLPSQRAVTASLSVNRLVAGRFERFASVKQYSDIVEANKSDVAVAAARLGRAAMLQKNVPQAAVKDIQAVLGSSALAPEYHHMATALRLKLNNRMLEVAEAQLVASGGDAEEGVADLRKAVETDLDTIAKNRPDCMLVKMAKAELLLMEAKYDEALPLLKEITDTPSASSAQADGVVTLNGQNAGAILSLYKDSGEDLKEVPKELLDALKEALKLPQAKTEELLALAEVLRSVATSHVYIDFFCPSEEYITRYDDNMAALFCENNFSESIAAYEGPRSGADVISPKSLSELMGKSSAILEDCKEKFATKYSEAGKLLQEFAKQRQARQELFKSSASLEGLVTELKGFLIERARLDTVLILEQQQRLTEAKALVEKCRNAPTWKRLMLSGRIKRACGALVEADKDFVELFKLKKTHGFDVPPFDTYRTKSVF